jgi:hypothetical protein
MQSSVLTLVRMLHSPQLKDINDTSSGCPGGNSLSTTVTSFLGKPLNKVSIEALQRLCDISRQHLTILLLCWDLSTENAAV